MISYVLEAIPDEDAKLLDKSTTEAAEAVEVILKDGIDKAMNIYN
jgi:peptidyl-tRNA hydrolase